MHPARLFVLCGLPGSGKTTRATELAERFRAVRLSADDWMERLGIDIWDEEVRAGIELVQRELATSVLAGGSNVVVEWGTWLRRQRDELRVVARQVGALVHLEYLDAPLDELWERIHERAREEVVGSRAIRRADLEKWAAVIDRPTDHEWAVFDPMPPVRAGERRGSPAYPYGSWCP